MNFSHKLSVAAVSIITMLVLPGAASAACPAGITNELSIVPPTPVWSGQVQRQDYQVTACTQTQRVTVEWIKIRNASQPWMMNAANRETLVPETSMGGAMVGTTSWTAPATVTPGMYGVITRYYAVGSDFPEAQAASSFSVAQDVCPNLDGGQSSVPTGLTSANGVCSMTLPPTGGNPTPLTPRPVITKQANVKQVRTGGNVTYTIRLINRGNGAMRNVRICDKIPRGMIYVKHTGRAYFSNGSVCWKTSRLASGKAITRKLTLSVSKTFKGRRIANTACATAANANRKCARAVVKVIQVQHTRPVGGVTG